MPDMGSGSRSDKAVRADERPDESEAERLDRNYGELLQEMRVLQAGVQILFAFLLTLPFQSAFGQVDDFQRTVYMSTLVAAALAAICVIGPVPFHRFVFRRGMKDDLIKATTRYVGSGLIFLFLSMIGAIMLAAGLFTRLVAPMVAVQMAMICLIHYPKWAWIDRGMEYPFLMGLVALHMSFRGGGRFSADGLIGREL